MKQVFKFITQSIVFFIATFLLFVVGFIAMTKIIISISEEAAFIFVLLFGTAVGKPISIALFALYPFLYVYLYRKILGVNKNYSFVGYILQFVSIVLMSSAIIFLLTTVTYFDFLILLTVPIPLFLSVPWFLYKLKNIKPESIKDESYVVPENISSMKKNLSGLVEDPNILYTVGILLAILLIVFAIFGGLTFL